MPAVRISAGFKFEKGRYYHENNPHTEQSGADGRLVSEPPFFVQGER